MNGVVIMLKPPGLTSHRLVARVKKLLQVKKAGHTGTLDPGAAGVLPVCVGWSTRIAAFLQEDDKEYRAEMTLGRTTDTQDAAGRILASAPVPSGLDLEYFRELCLRFTGAMMQTPPMYSAVRFQGRKLYEWARDGYTVDRPSRRVTVYRLCPLDYRQDGDVARLIFDLRCSKGTYVRSLCAAIGEAVGCGAHLSFLVRTRSGSFTLDRSVTLEELQEACARGEQQRLLIPPDQALDSFPALRLPAREAARHLNGAVIEGAPLEAVAGELPAGLVRVYDHQGTFIAISSLSGARRGRRLKPEKVNNTASV